MKRSTNIFAILFFLASAAVPAIGLAFESSQTSIGDSGDKMVAKEMDSKTDPELATVETPFDYDPYKVLIWWVCDDPAMPVEIIADELAMNLERDFFALWRTTIQTAPPSVATLARRDLSRLSYQSLIAADPVFAVRRDHPEANRLRTFNNMIEFVETISTDRWRRDAMINTLQSANPTAGEQLGGKFAISNEPIDQVWKRDGTEAVLTSRGIAESFDEPKAKLIDPPAGDFVANQIEPFDKIFIVRLSTDSPQPEVTVVEMDRLMRHFGAPIVEPVGELVTSRIDVVASAIRESFRPIVRIEEAGRKTASGLVRGGGLIVEDDNPGRIQVGDILEPMLRKEDRNGVPFVVGPLDWSFLVTTKADNRLVDMDFWSGRTGSLQGRKNNRTYRHGLRVKPRGRGSELRLHAKGDVDQSLVGYEIYDKDLETDKTSFVGRTDWKGTLQIEPSDGPFRLLYVKNGGAILARLPIVPGLHQRDVANLVGDDERLQAEAYIKGVQNSIIDLVAVRELFKARVQLRIERGEIDKAEELMLALSQQPTSRELNDAIGKRKVVFLKSIENKSQLKKVDEMFSTTQDLLGKFINPKLVQDLEVEFLAAKRKKDKPAASKEDDKK